nr:MAG TPA: SOS-response transcriptional repressor [Caudoviricetes sp.]
MISRIKDIIKLSGLSDRAFALKCGINQQTLFNQLKGIRAISLDTVISICKTFPEISRDWLLLGEGDMFKSQSRETERINKLVDTIATLQESINAKSETIAILNDRIKQIENQRKK